MFILSGNMNKVPSKKTQSTKNMLKGKRKLALYVCVLKVCYLWILFNTHYLMRCLHTGFDIFRIAVVTVLQTRNIFLYLQFVRVCLYFSRRHKSA